MSRAGGQGRGGCRRRVLVLATLQTWDIRYARSAYPVWSPARGQGAGIRSAGFGRQRGESCRGQSSSGRSLLRSSPVRRQLAGRARHARWVGSLSLFTRTRPRLIALPSWRFGPSRASRGFQVHPRHHLGAPAMTIQARTKNTPSETRQTWDCLSGPYRPR
jgi:hypothetical protein